jgi:hypothetical protein
MALAAEQGGQSVLPATEPPSTLRNCTNLIQSGTPPPDEEEEATMDTRSERRVRESARTACYASEGA